MKRGSVDMMAGWMLAEQPSGATTWTTTILFKDSSGPFGRVINRILARTFERLTLQSQAELKRLIEEEYSMRARIGNVRQSVEV